jgi:hypothetical protein
VKYRAWNVILTLDLLAVSQAKKEFFRTHSDNLAKPLPHCAAHV